MKILLLGSGGREHALAWKIAQSPKVDKLYIAPGNAGTANVGENVDIKADDFERLKDFAAANRLISAITKGIMACAYLYMGNMDKQAWGMNGAYVGLIIISIIAFALIFCIKPLRADATA